MNEKHKIRKRLFFLKRKEIVALSIKKDYSVVILFLLTYTIYEGDEAF